MIIAEHLLDVAAGTPSVPVYVLSICCVTYARRMGQPTQRATNYTARSNIDTAQIFLHKKIRAYGATRLYTHSHEFPALTALAQHISYSHSGIDEKRPTEKFVLQPVDLVLIFASIGLFKPDDASIAVDGVNHG